MMGPRPGMMIPGMPITGQPPAQGSLSMGAMMNPGMLLPSHQQPLTIAPLPGNQGPLQQGGVPGMHMGFMPDGSQPLTSLPQPSDPFTSPLLSGAPLSLPGNQQGFPVASGSLPASGSMGMLQAGDGSLPEAGAQGLGLPTSNAALQQQDPAGMRVMCVAFQKAFSLNCHRCSQTRTENMSPHILCACLGFLEHLMVTACAALVTFSLMHVHRICNTKIY